MPDTQYISKIKLADGSIVMLKDTEARDFLASSGYITAEDANNDGNIVIKSSLMPVAEETQF